MDLKFQRVPKSEPGMAEILLVERSSNPLL